MDTWLTSYPFWGAGIYIGGSMASCRPRRPHRASRTSTPRGWLGSGPADGGCRSGLARRPRATLHYGDLVDANPAGAYAAADGRGRSEAPGREPARELGLPAGTTLWNDLEGGFDLANDDSRRRRCAC